MTTNSTKRATMRRSRRRGFTLTEIAIVLGIVGLILGSIWAAASAVYANMKASQAQQGITLAAQTVRTMFAGSNQTGATGAKQDITAPGMFPVSWAGTAVGVTGNPWEQNPPASYSYVIADSGTPSQFSVELDGISADGCVSLIGFYNAAASTLAGGQIAGLVGNATSVAAVVAGTATIKALSAAYVLPKTCTGVGNTNSISVTFDMKNM